MANRTTELKSQDVVVDDRKSETCSRCANSTYERVELGQVLTLMFEITHAELAQPASMRVVEGGAFADTALERERSGACTTRSRRWMLA